MNAEYAVLIVRKVVSFTIKRATFINKKKTDRSGSVGPVKTDLGGNAHMSSFVY